MTNYEDLIREDDPIMPYVKAEFWLEADDFDLNAVSDALGEAQVILRKETRPLNAIRGDCWEMNTGEIRTWSVEEVMDQLIDRLKGKVEWIVEFCKRNAVDAGFTIVLKIDKDDSPAMSLTAKQIQFIASLNATLDWDVYIYTEGFGDEGSHYLHTRS